MSQPAPDRPVCTLSTQDHVPWLMMRVVSKCLKHHRREVEAREFRLLAQVIGFDDPDDTTELLALIMDYVDVQ